MHGHDGEELINGPGVRQRLENTEVAVVDVRKIGVDVLQVPGNNLELVLLLGNAHEDCPEKALGQAALAQIDSACGKKLTHFAAVVDGVVVAFLQIAGSNVDKNLAQVLDWLRAVLWQILGQLHGFDYTCVKNVEEQKGIVGNRGPARFGHNVRMGHTYLVQGAHDGFHYVRAVFVQGVVARGDVVCVRAVVVHGKAAAKVDVAHGRAFLHKARVEAGAFLHAQADVADIGNLGSQMVVKQAQAIEHVVCLELVNKIHDFCRGEAEDRTLATGLCPVATCPGGQLAAHAKFWPHVVDAGALQYGFELAGHFDDKEDVQTNSLCLKAQVNEFPVLVAVADKAGFPVGKVGDCGNELALGAHFQAVVVARAEVGDFLNHLLLLIDLDGEDPTVTALVAKVLDGLAEGLVQIGNLRIENVFHPEQAGHVVAPFLDAFDDLGNGHFGTLGAIGTDNNIAV